MADTPTPDKSSPPAPPALPPQGKGALAVKPAPAKTPPERKHLPRYKVLLHNDDVHGIEDVVRTVMVLANLSAERSMQIVEEAHKTGVALILVTHKELAELRRDQFTSKGLTVTIEPDQ